MVPDSAPTVEQNSLCKAAKKVVLSVIIAQIQGKRERKTIHSVHWGKGPGGLQNSIALKPKAPRNLN